MGFSNNGAQFVGRSDELATLDDLARDLARGAGGMLWIEGEPGIGKTALVQQLVTAAEALHSKVLRGAAEELTQPFPLRVMAHSLGVATGTADPIRAEIAGLISGRLDAGVLDPVLAAGERMLELVDRLCASGPLLLVIEDLHWADGPSLTIWERLGRATDQMPLLLVGTSRPVPQRAETDRLRAQAEAGSAVVIRLGPLPADSVAELASGVLGAEPEPDLVGVLEQAGGNPRYLRELIAAWQSGDSSLTLSAAIGRRLDFLKPETRQVLRLAALLGREFELGELATVTGDAPGELMSALEDGLAAGTLVAQGSRMAFRHELIRQALHDETAGPLRTGLHVQFARRLAQSGAEIDAVAQHLLASPAAIERWAVQWLADLPESTLFAVPEVACELLVRAVRAPGATGDMWAVLAGRYAAVCFTLGRDAEAEEMAAEVAQTVQDPDLRGRMLVYRVRAASRQGRNEHALAVASAAQRDGQLPEIWSVRIRARAAVVLAKENRPAQAREEAERALADAKRIADPVAAGHSHLVLSHLSAGVDALSHIDAGLAGLGTDPDAMDLRLMLTNNKLAVLNNLGRRDDFRTAATEMLIVASKAGTMRSGRLAVAAAMGSFDFGQWDEALDYLDSIPTSQPAVVCISTTGLAALIAGHREDWPRLQTAASLGSAVPITPGDVRISSGYLVAARALRAEADGDLERAIREMRGWLDPDLGFDAKERHMWLPDLVRLALAASDMETAREAVAAAQSDAKLADPWPRPLAAAEFCRAQLDDDVPALTRVAKSAQEHGWLLMHASAQEEAAIRLAAAGDIGTAREALNEAARVYTSFGASWDLRRADARLRPYGVRRGPRSLHRRPATGWDALTPTERRVASLVADGRSNPDIAAELYISRRTAQTHVSRVLRKLELSSRMDLIRSPIEARP